MYKFEQNFDMSYVLIIKPDCSVFKPRLYHICWHHIIDSNTFYPNADLIDIRSTDQINREHTCMEFVWYCITKSKCWPFSVGFKFSERGDDK